MIQEEIRVSQVSKEEFEEMQNTLKKNDRQLTEMAEKYNNRFEKVISDQQRELDKYREGILKNTLNFTFGTVAKIYDDSYLALNKIVNSEYDLQKKYDLLKTRFEEMLEEVMQCFRENEIEEHKSEIGTQYNKIKCEVLTKDPTGDESLNGRIIKSYNTGFYRGATILVPELVDIYVYNKNLDESLIKVIDQIPNEEKNNIETIDTQTDEEFNTSGNIEPEVPLEKAVTEKNNSEESIKNNNTEE